MSVEEVVKRRYYNERKEIITCDLCGSKHTSRADIKRCMVCGKDVCLGCVVSLTRASKWWHNHNNWCCSICWAVGKDRRAIMDSAEEKFELLVEKEFAIWRHDIGGVEDGQ